MLGNLPLLQRINANGSSMINFLNIFSPYIITLIMTSSIWIIFATFFACAHVGAIPYSNLPPLSRRQDSTDPFALPNAQLAQQMNLEAQTAQVGDSCPVDGIPSCIGTGFSQCLNGQLLAPQPCGEGTQCVALPATGQAGTIITCDTLDDAIMRITAASATGGLTGEDNSTSNDLDALSNIPGAIPAVPKVSQVVNLSLRSTETSADAATATFSPEQVAARKAQTFNRIFSDKTIGDSCDNIGSEYCLNDGSLSLCDNGYLSTSQPCGSGTICMALPGAANDPVITCDTVEDGLARFSAAGVSGGLTGF